MLRYVLSLNPYRERDNWVCHLGMPFHAGYEDYSYGNGGYDDYSTVLRGDLRHGSWEILDQTKKGSELKR